MTSENSQTVSPALAASRQIGPPDLAAERPAGGKGLSALLVIGPFPPPVHGFAAITLAMSDAVAGFRPVIRSNLASNARNKLLRHATQIGLFLLACLRIIVFRLRGGELVSVGANGGWGLIYTVALVALIRGLGLRISLHHHSYAYIMHRSRLMQTLCQIGGKRLEHVFLAQSMQDAFFAQYRPVSAAHVLPNAIFVPKAPVNIRPQTGRSTVGLLSNLGREKGLYEFIEVARRVKAAGLPVDMVLAGPARQPDDIAAIAAAESAGLLRAFGPLYGPKKIEFFQSLDLFLFPTHHIDEAQPTVIYEAFACGVPVFAIARGAIAEQTGDCVGTVPIGGAFAAAALETCRQLAQMSAPDLTALREMARQRHADDTTRGELTLWHIYGPNTH